MKTKVIVISGHAGHGKDTVARLIKKVAIHCGDVATIVHYADPLKCLCKQMFDWNGEKDDYGRELLQSIGTDIVRDKNPDFWVNFLGEFISILDDTWDYVIIPDARFPNEIEKLRDFGIDPIHIRVYRPNYKSDLTEEQANHESETALDNCFPNYYITNNGTIDDMLYEVISIMLDITEKHMTELIAESMKGTYE